MGLVGHPYWESRDLRQPLISYSQLTFFGGKLVESQRVLQIFLQTVDMVSQKIILIVIPYEN